MVQPGIIQQRQLQRDERGQELCPIQDTGDATQGAGYGMHHSSR
jgi:hypothetical protein